MERAVFGTRTGEVLVGYGPFTAQSEAPSAGVAFYKNNFSLSQEKPWLIPDRVEVLESVKESRPAEISWEEADAEPFAEVFREVSSAISQGVIEKSVPVVTVSGQGEVSPDVLLGRLLNLPANLRPYGRTWRVDWSSFRSLLKGIGAMVSIRKRLKHALWGTRTTSSKRCVWSTMKPQPALHRVWQKFARPLIAAAIRLC